MTIKPLAIVLALATLALPTWADAPENVNQNAQQSGSSSSAGIHYRGWGLRAGVADDIDQVVGGAHFNMGEFIPQLRFQPDIQLGVGDDHTTLFITAPVYYRFRAGQKFTPYVGGGPTAGWIDHDHGGNTDSDFEIGGKLTGGLEWPRSGGRALLVELSAGFGDVHDVQAVVGWSF